MPKPGHAGHLFQFVDFSVKYFVIARDAFFLPGYVPPSANLFHHAFEYLFKYRWLVQEIEAHYGGDPKLDTAAEQQAFVTFMDGKQREMANTFGHDLPPIWSAFKATVGIPALRRFDAVVAELQKWEGVRYPWFPAGAQQMQTLLRRADRAASGGSMPVDSFVLCLEDMDELFREAFLAARLNPGVLRGRLLHAAAGDAYDRENYHKLC
jgi:hypothetical protein